MTPLHIVVEGPTEEAFVKEVLFPHLEAFRVWATPVIVATSRAPDGHKRKGGGAWGQWRKDIQILLRDSRSELRVTTMFDLYGLPGDFPARDVNDRDTSTRAVRLEAAMAEAIEDRRLIPYLQRHEFEALVLASLPALRTIVHGDATEAVDALRREITVPPEDVNDGKETAPSKRLLRVPGYQKTVHGPGAVKATGLAALRASCTRFGAWVTLLEGLT